MSVLRTIAIGALLATIAGAGAHATLTPLFDNSSLSPFGSVTASNATSGLPTPHGALAESFASGVLASTLKSVSLDLKLSGTAGTGSIIVTLNAASGSPGTPGTPGASLATLATILDNTLSTTAAFQTITGLSVALTANTEYFIVVTDVNPLSHTKVQWLFANGSGGTGTSSQVGLFSATEPTQWTGTTAFPYLLTVVADAPEPAALALLGVGIAGLGWVRNRRNTRKV